MAAHFVDAQNALNYTVQRIHLLHRLIARCADLFDYALVRFVFGVNRQNMFARRVENHFGEWNPAQLSIFIK